ncbi:MAG: nitroreductase family protein [Campylobacteraceae bacterium]|jgi:nitroreductase|nr:nitroreductase family protein [Campylobacteraceae bacterium]
MSSLSDTVLSVIYKRKSVRSFKNGRKEIPKETLEAIIKTAFAAPSAMNLQPWHFIVITNHSILNTLGDALPYAKMLYKASAAVIVCADTKVSEFAWELDCSAASQNILLSVEAFGLGAVWTALYPHEERALFVKNLFHLPENITPLNVIPIGYPDGTEQPKDKYIAQKVHVNAWQSV